MLWKLVFKKGFQFKWVSLIIMGYSGALIISFMCLFMLSTLLKLALNRAIFSSHTCMSASVVV